MADAHLRVFRGTPSTEGTFEEFDVPAEEGKRRAHRDRRREEHREEQHESDQEERRAAARRPVQPGEQRLRGEIDERADDPERADDRLQPRVEPKGLG